MVPTTHSLVLDKFDEHLLIGCPIFKDVPTRREQTHQSDVEQKVMSYSVITFSVLKKIIDAVVILQFFG